MLEETYSLESFLDVQEVKQELQINLDYALKQYQGNQLVSYALNELYNNDNAIKNNVQVELLEPLQEEYLQAIDQNDSTIKEICDEMRISKTTIIIWIKTNKLFAKCIELIKEAEAEQIESVVTKAAQDSNSADNISRMFALKARKPEYRDNAVLTGATIVNVRVTVDGENFDTSASVKDISENE
jgi:predicted DNA-binding protein YlxM (UPF0122 family)